MKFILLFVMIFCHMIADYNLQGILANLKQKRWWRENADDPKYENDWKIALIEHSFVWSFMVHIPVIYVYYNESDKWFILISLSIVLHTIIHAIIDHLKANKLIINLTTDQVCHLGQILLAWILFIFAR